MIFLFITDNPKSSVGIDSVNRDLYHLLLRFLSCRNLQTVVLHSGSYKFGDFLKNLHYQFANNYPIHGFPEENLLQYDQLVVVCFPLWHIFPAFCRIICLKRAWVTHPLMVNSVFVLQSLMFDIILLLVTCIHLFLIAKNSNKLLDVFITN